MDIQKIISDVIIRLASKPDLIQSFLSNPVATLEKTLGIDLPDEQINQVIEGVKGQLDLGKLGLDDLNVGKAVGILGKLKGMFGK